MPILEEDPDNFCKGDVIYLVKDPRLSFAAWLRYFLHLLLILDITIESLIHRLGTPQFFPSPPVCSTLLAQF